MNGPERKDVTGHGQGARESDSPGTAERAGPAGPGSASSVAADRVNAGRPATSAAPSMATSLSTAGLTGPSPDGGSKPAFDLVAVAASAGGLDALSTVLGALAPGFEAAVVVVQHLDPRHRTLLDTVLGRRTRLPVSLAEDGDCLRPGTVLVAPPDRHLLVNPGGTVGLSRSELVHFVRPSADLLFDSAAGSYGDRVIAVVLTGTGSDGSMGVRAVHQSGGTVLAQDAATSMFFGMPGAAIETGMVDFVLGLDEIGPALIALVGGTAS